jgi:2-polyprenyl-3-methyl-5-hydroxy-6-metoxy-1,4-benzoquinol methylase
MSAQPDHQASVVAFYSSWDGQRTYVNPRTVIKTLRQRRIPPDARILDIGFGNGEIALAVARAYPQARIEGIDLTAYNVTMAGRKADEAGLKNVAFRVKDAESWQSPAGAYHAIYAMQVMQFIARPEALMRRIFTGLHPGGAILFATPFLPPDPALHPFFLDAYARVIPNSFQYRTEDAWYAGLFDAGFERIYTAKAHWEPAAQPPDWREHYRRAVEEHGLDFETARRHTWGGLISARKPGS